MDPRRERSRRRLLDAVLEAAEQRPILDVTVTEVSRLASVTRDTFYRHATSPVDLLGDALAEEISDAEEAHLQGDSLDEAERVLLQHVRDRVQVYRSAMQPGLVAPVRAALQSAIETGLERWAANHPAIVPARYHGDDPAWSMAVAYAAGGTVAAIEAWLRGPMDDLDGAVAAVLEASAPWWHVDPA